MSLVWQDEPCWPAHVPVVPQGVCGAVERARLTSVSTLTIRRRRAILDPRRGAPRIAGQTQPRSTDGLGPLQLQRHLGGEDVEANSRRCAVCHSEYAAEYDACPHCAGKKAQSRRRVWAAFALLWMPLAFLWLWMDLGSLVGGWVVWPLAAFFGLALLGALATLIGSGTTAPTGAPVRTARSKFSTCPHCGKTGPRELTTCQWCHTPIVSKQPDAR